MPRTKRDDFYEELERIEKELGPLMDATQVAVKHLFDVPFGPEKAVALADYRREEAAERRAFERRRKFLEKYRP